MIYDCFCFFNEFDLLELRLNELKDVVDRFVLAEADITHTGRPKKRLFWENRERFKPFLNRILYIPVFGLTMPGPDAMNREIQQRKQLQKALVALQPDDLVLLGDVDEIPRAASFPNELIEDFKPFNQNLYFYKFNLTFGNTWRGTVLYQGSTILTYPIGRNGRCWSTQLCRIHRHKRRTIVRGGWHFSWLGNEEAFHMKLSSYSHSEAIMKAIQDLKSESVQSLLEKRLAPFSDKPNKPLKRVKFDDSFPKFLLDNKERFSHLIAE